MGAAGRNARAWRRRRAVGAFHPDPAEHVVVGLLEHGEVLVAKRAKFVRCARATGDGLAAHRTRIGRD